MENPKITLTMTTCRRLHLFERTVRSFAQHCLDLDLITDIVCVDDNSPLEECKIMYKLLVLLFPNRKISLISKNYKDRGLGRSLNMIFENVKTKYAFHLEDDWEFIKDGHFIKDALNIIQDSDNIKSVLVNSVHDLPVGCTKNGFKYNMLELGAKVNNGDVIWAWGYSFRPALLDLEHIRSEIKGFKMSDIEMLFGQEYYYKGMRQVTLTDGEYARHIGVPENNERSAFDLNWTPR